VQTLTSQVQKISFPILNLNFPSTKNQLSKCKKLASHVQTLTSQVQKISLPKCKHLNFPSTKNSFSSANISFSSAKNQLSKCKH
jgi:hypothetical protein